MATAAAAWQGTMLACDPWTQHGDQPLATQPHKEGRPTPMQRSWQSPASVHLLPPIRAHLKATGVYPALLPGRPGQRCTVPRCLPPTHLDGLPSQQLCGHLADAPPRAVVCLCPLHLLISQQRMPGHAVLRQGRRRGCAMFGQVGRQHHLCVSMPVSQGSLRFGRPQADASKSHGTDARSVREGLLGCPPGVLPGSRDSWSGAVTWPSPHAPAALVSSAPAAALVAWGTAEGLGTCVMSQEAPLPRRAAQLSERVGAATAMAAVIFLQQTHVRGAYERTCPTTSTQLLCTLQRRTAGGDPNRLASVGSSSQGGRVGWRWSAFSS